MYIQLKNKVYISFNFCSYSSYTLLQHRCASYLVLHLRCFLSLHASIASLLLLSLSYQQLFSRCARVASYRYTLLQHRFLLLNSFLILRSSFTTSACARPASLNTALLDISYYSLACFLSSYILHYLSRSLYPNHTILNASYASRPAPAPAPPRFTTSARARYSIHSLRFLSSRPIHSNTSPALVLHYLRTRSLFASYASRPAPSLPPHALAIRFASLLIA